MRRWLLAPLLPALAGCAVLGGAPGPEQAATTGQPPLAITLDDGSALTATLRFPAGGGPFPAVILLHDCDGPTSRAVEAWQRELGAWGYATLAVDSFGARRVVTTCDSPSKLWFAERVPDAYAAFAALVLQPKIARDRVALMGWGDGGTAAIRAASLTVAEHFARPKAARFRTFVAFYPDCRVFFAPDAGTARPEMTTLAAPVRIHAGDTDDRAPVVPCQTLAQRLVASGNPVTLTVYKGAGHAFDSEPAPVLRPRAEGVEPKAAGQTPAPTASAPNSGAGTTLPRPAAAKKPVSHWNPEATASARQSVREQLATLLGPA